MNLFKKLLGRADVAVPEQKGARVIINDIVALKSLTNLQPLLNLWRKDMLPMGKDADLVSLLDQYNGAATGKFVQVSEGNNEKPLRVWRREGLPPTPDNMAALTEIRDTVNGQDVFIPGALYLGKESGLLLSFRLACCGEEDMGVLISYYDKAKQKPQMRVLVNPPGLERQLHQYFSGRVYFADPASSDPDYVRNADVLEHLHQHAANISHDCSGRGLPAAYHLNG